MEVTGKIKLIGETQTFDSGFRKRELVVTTLEQYPQHISIEFLQDKVELLDKFKVDENLKVYINLRGREWLDPKTDKNRYFNSITGWKIDKADIKDMPTLPTVDMGSGSKDESFDDLSF